MGTENVSLSEVLAQAQSSRCLEVIGQRYRLRPVQAQRASDLMRPVLLRQIDAALATTNGAHDMLRIFTQPAFAQIEHDPSAISEQSVRLAGDALHRQLSHYDHDVWVTLDRIAREIGISHQTFRAMVPCLTLVIVAALRKAAAPAFLRLLLQHRPDDTSTDPFAYACEHADALQGRSVPSKTALRWLDLVLSRTDNNTDALHADPRHRIG